MVLTREKQMVIFIHINALKLASSINRMVEFNDAGKVWVNLGGS